MPEETHWTRLEELFHSSLNEPPGERVAFVAKRTATDPDLRREALALLESHAAVEAEFLEPGATSAFGAVQDLSGTLVGGHQLQRLIARGGMGAVYEAEQDRPRRRVALKLLSTGFQTARARRRFEFEVELLARLDHPAVAQIYEAGVHEGTGGTLPYFVMELVPGARDFASYCEEEALTVRERIELFLEVAEAVEHGHQRGVLHRDLKPGNVLVDDAGRPKVIDFGVARATTGGSGETLTTSEGEIVGTLAYMSPEQAAGDPSLIDVRTDVYALGGLLYRVLTGRPPHEVEGLPLTEAMGVVQEKPTRSLSEFHSNLRGDLETVLSGALAKERSERYPTVNALVQELRRYLRSEPVLRTPPSPWHVFRLFVRRNRRTVLAVTAFVLVLLAASVTSVRFGLQARAAAEEERIASRRSEQVSRFLERILEAAEPASNFGREATVREVLEEARITADTEYVGDPDVEAEIRGILGGAYLALGDYMLSEEQFRRMEELWESTSIPRAAYAARKRLEFAELLLKVGPSEEAAPLIAAAHSAFMNEFGADSVEALLAEEARSQELRSRDEYESAIALSRQVLERLEGLLSPRSPEVLGVRSRLAYTLMRAGQFEEAEEQLREVKEAWTDLRGPDDPRVTLARRDRGDVLTALGRFDEAAEEIEFVVGVVEAIWGESHPNVITSRLQLGRIRGWQGRYDEARALLDQVLEAGMAIPAIRDRAIANTCQSIAQLEIERGDFATAMEYAERAIPAWAAVFGEDNYRTWKSRVTLALAQMESGRPGEAEEVLRGAVDINLEQLGEEHDTTISAMETLAECLLRQGRASEAEALLRPLIPRRDQAQGPLFPRAIGLVALRARCLLAAGQTSEALVLAEEAVRRVAEAGSSKGASAATIAATLGLCQGGEAGERALLDAYGQLELAHGANNPRTRSVARWLADHYARRGLEDQSRAWRNR